MNLSLEVKKFMNNEHTGEYVSVILPSELPVDRSEVREHNKDKTAANTAKGVAESKARLADKAKEKAANSEKLHSLKEEELEDAKVVLDEIVTQQTAMQPELDEKRSIFDEAAADFDEKNAVYTAKRAAFEALEKSYNDAVDAERAASLKLNECRAILSGAESALAAAKEDGARHEGKLSSTRSEVAEAKVFADNAKEEAREASKLEAEKNERYVELSERTAQLSAIMKKEGRRLADAQKALVSASKEYTKATSDNASLIEALASAENAVKESTKVDKESLKAKVINLKSKLAAAATRVEYAEAAKAEAEQNLEAAQDVNGKAEINYNKIYEMMSACKGELDVLRAKASSAAAKAAEAQARYTSLSTSFDKTQDDLDFSVRDVRNREQGLVDSKKSLLNAETDVSVKHEAVLAAREDMEKAKAVMDDAQAVMKKSEAIYNSKKASFDAINNSYQMAERDRKTQNNIVERLDTELRILKDQLDDDILARDNAIEDAESSEAEADRMFASVREVNARYETAKIHYIQQGKGEDIILIHSVGQSLYTFRELISKLSSKFRVTALDLVGFGYSEKPYYFNYSLDEMADFIKCFMEAMNIEYAHLFGFSMGAGYVINFAKRYPDKVGKIVLLSPGGITPEMPSSIRSVDNRLIGGIAARMISYKAVKKMLLECFFDLTNHTEDLINEYYKPISSPESKRVIRTCVACYDDEEVIHSLRDVKADTLILWGNEDKWHPTDMANLFQAVMPSVKFTLVRNAGHLAHEEKAERIAQLIKLFIPCGYDEDDRD